MTIGTPAALVVEVDSAGPAAEVDAEFDRVQEICRRNDTTHIRIATDPDERAILRKGRKAAFAAMGRMSPYYFVQDGVIRDEPGATFSAVSPASRRRTASAWPTSSTRRRLSSTRSCCTTPPSPGSPRAQSGWPPRSSSRSSRAFITGEHGVGSDKACSMPRRSQYADLTVMADARARGLHRRHPQPGQGAAHASAVRERPGPAGASVGGIRPHRAVRRSVVAGMARSRARQRLLSGDLLRDSTAARCCSAGTHRIYGLAGCRCDLLIIETTGLNRLLEHNPADMTAVVEAGSAAVDNAAGRLRVGSGSRSIQPRRSTAPPSVGFSRPGVGPAKAAVRRAALLSSASRSCWR